MVDHNINIVTLIQISHRICVMQADGFNARKMLVI